MMPSCHERVACLAAEDADIRLPAVPRLSERELSLLNLLLRVSRKLSVFAGDLRPDGAQAPLHTTLERSRADVPDANARADVRIDIGDGERRIALSLDEVACCMLVEPLVSRDTFNALNENLTLATLICALDPWLTAFEKTSGVALRVESVVQSAPSPPAEAVANGVADTAEGTAVDTCCLCVSLAAPKGGTAMFRLLCNAAAAETFERLLASMQEIPLRDAVPEWPVLIRFHLGTSELSTRELAALEVGDAVLLERCALTSDRTLDVLFGERHRARGKLVDHQVKLIRSGDTLLDSNEDHDTSGKIDAMTVQLDFELGRCELSIAELRHLKEGRVFDLGGGDRDAAVALRCNGRIVGYGELVEINGLRYGVRVTERTD